MGPFLFMLGMAQAVYLMALSPVVSTLTVDTTVEDMQKRIVNLENNFRDMITLFGAKEMKFKLELQRIKKDNEMLKRDYSDLYKKYIYLEKTRKNQSVEERADSYAGKGFKKGAQMSSSLSIGDYSNLSETDGKVSLVTRREGHRSFTSSNVTKAIKVSNIKKVFAVKTSTELDYMNTDINDSAFQQKPTRNESNRIKRKDSRSTPIVRDSAVAFYARLRNPLENIGDNQHIIFDEIVTLEGNDYDGATGVFTCSVPGIYVFSVTLLTYPDKYLEVHVIRNGSIFAQLYSYNDNHLGSSSDTAVIRLNVGDRVWIRVNGNQHGSGSNLYNLYSTFTGFLLHA